MIPSCSRTLRDREGATLARSELSRLTVVVASGAATLRIDGSALAAWLPLRGQLQLAGPRSAGAVLPGEMCVTDAVSSGMRTTDSAPGGMHPTEAASTIRAHARRGLWLAVIGDAMAWRDALAQASGQAPHEPVLLPARHVANRDVRRRAVALARAAAVASEGTSPFTLQRARNDAPPPAGAATLTVPDAFDAALLAMLDVIAAQQAQLAGAIARCPGRTYAKRRQVFARLQRVRNYLSANCHLDYDNAAIARLANYSAHYFLRTFHAVFDETPHAFLVDQRLQRARWLLRTSPLAVTEVAHASGFGNRCAFSRLFRERFGTCARAVRLAAAARAAHTL